MKFGYAIVYVPNVESSLAFFETAFGCSRRFLHESGDYGELATGETTIAFASVELGHVNFPSGYLPIHSLSAPVGIELAFITDSVPAAHSTALRAGATEIRAPETKPWGQVVSYVRCPDGVLVELCTAVTG
jgi:lactoylglutathione lyase